MHVQVARLMLKGMAQGRYVLHFPDVLSTWICAGLGGTSELCLPVIMTALVAPLVVSPVCRLISEKDFNVICHITCQSQLPTPDGGNTIAELIHMALVVIIEGSAAAGVACIVCRIHIH